jgi:hypothetical protein
MSRSPPPWPIPGFRSTYPSALRRHLIHDTPHPAMNLLAEPHTYAATYAIILQRYACLALLRTLGREPLVADQFADRLLDASDRLFVCALGAIVKVFPIRGGRSAFACEFGIGIGVGVDVVAFGNFFPGL